MRGPIWSTGKSELVECVGNVNCEKYFAILEKELFQIFSGGVLNKSMTLFMEDGSPCLSAKKI